MELCGVEMWSKLLNTVGSDGPDSNHPNLIVGKVALAERLDRGYTTLYAGYPYLSDRRVSN